MPAKPKGGKRQQRHQTRDADYARELILKEDGEDYGVVLKELGNRMLKVYCLGDEVCRRCHIPKSVREKVRVGNVVLVTKRDYATTDDEADIYNKYQDEEVRQLKEFGYIPQDLDSIIETEMAKISAGQGKTKPVQIADEQPEDEPQKEIGNDEDIEDL